MNIELYTSIQYDKELIQHYFKLYNNKRLDDSQEGRAIILERTIKQREFYE